MPELGRTLGEELLVPTRIYARDCLALIDAVEVHAMSHVTGGGLANNLARVIPGACEVRIDRSDLAARAGLQPDRPAGRGVRSPISRRR